MSRFEHAQHGFRALGEDIYRPLSSDFIAFSRAAHIRPRIPLGQLLLPPRTLAHALLGPRRAVWHRVRGPGGSLKFDVLCDLGFQPGVHTQKFGRRASATPLPPSKLLPRERVYHDARTLRGSRVLDAKRCSRNIGNDKISGRNTKERAFRLAHASHRGERRCASRRRLQNSALGVHGAVFVRIRTAFASSSPEPHHSSGSKWLECRTNTLLPPSFRHGRALNLCGVFHESFKTRLAPFPRAPRRKISTPLEQFHCVFAGTQNSPAHCARPTPPIALYACA